MTDLCFVCEQPYPRERAELGYGYCMKPACVKAGKQPLKFIAVAQNKAADAINILTPEAEEESRTKLRDVRRAVVKSERGSEQGGAAREVVVIPSMSEIREREKRRRRALPGTPRQQRLVHIYREQGIRPAVIAEKTGLSMWAVNQVLQSRMRRTL